MSSLSLQASPFADELVDVSELNGSIFDQLATRLEEVQQAAMTGHTTAAAAYVVLGAAGSGKTHLFARLRQHQQPRVTAVLVRPFFGVGLTPRDVLSAVVDQLCLPVRGSAVGAIELLARTWLLFDEVPPDTTWHAEDLRVLEGAERREHADLAVARLVALLPSLAPMAHVARAVLLLEGLEDAARWAELAWLSGREPRHGSVVDAEPPRLSEADVLQMLRLLAALTAPWAPLVLVFDQLENLASQDDTAALAYGNLIAELVDSVTDLTVLQLALTSEWMQFIEPRLSLPQKSRVAARTWVLEEPDRHQRELLLRAWCTRVPTVGRRKRFPHPLSATELNELLEAPGMTPRLLLTSLLRKADGQSIVPDAPPVPAPARLASEWQTYLGQVETELVDKHNAGIPIDAAALAEGLVCALSFAPGLESTARTERERVTVTVHSPGHELVVSFLTGLHHSAVSSGLARASELARAGKVVVLREARFELPTSWSSVQERRSAYECLPNARWLWLTDEDAARLLTLARIASLARARRLGGSEAGPLTWESAQPELGRMLTISQWSCVTSIVRWLGDVPRERASVPAAGKPTATASTSPAPSDAALPSVSEWLRTGTQVGRSLLERYTKIWSERRPRKR